MSNSNTTAVKRPASPAKTAKVIPEPSTAEKARVKAHEAIDTAAEKAKEMERKIRDEAERLSNKASNNSENAKQQLDQSLEKIDAFIKERPLAAAGIAFASGAFAALLLKR